MKVVYIAHPISGRVHSNLDKIKQIVYMINIETQDVVPFVPYYVDCIAMDDDNPDHRKRGIKNDHELLSRDFIDELWLFGDKISKGMKEEIRLAYKYNIKIEPKTVGTINDYPETINSIKDASKNITPRSN